MNRRKVPLTPCVTEMIESIALQLKELVGKDLPGRLHCIENKLDCICIQFSKMEINENTKHEEKTLLSVAEASRYMDVKESYVYKLTNKRLIPCHKPFGRLIYIERKDLDAWMTKKEFINKEIDSNG